MSQVRIVDALEAEKKKIWQRARGAAEEKSFEGNPHSEKW